MNGTHSDGKVTFVDTVKLPKWFGSLRASDENFSYDRYQIERGGQNNWTYVYVGTHDKNVYFSELREKVAWDDSGRIAHTVTFFRGGLSELKVKPTLDYFIPYDTCKWVYD